MKRFLILFSIIFLFMGSPVYAYFYTGNELASLMKDWERSSDSDAPIPTLTKGIEFQAYVIGIYDLLSTGRIICEDVNRVTSKQIPAIVVKYLNENPEKWTKPAVLLVTEALKKAFPCKK